MARLVCIVRIWNNLHRVPHIKMIGII